MKFARVVLDNNLQKELEYAIPEELQGKIFPGMRVEVPLKGTVKKGFVLSTSPINSFPTPRQICALLEKENLPNDLFELAGWIAKYYCTPIRKVIKTILPSSVRKEIHIKEKIFLTSNKTKQELLELCKEMRLKNSAQGSVLEVFANSTKGMFLSDLLKEAKVSKSVTDSLIKKKIFIAQKLSVNDEEFFANEEYFKSKPKVLNSEQESAFSKISSTLEQKKFETHLVYGITGSGKTEIYLQAIQKALDLGRSAIILVPEISLTEQTIERFRSRFFEKIALIHHRKSHGEKNALWHAIKAGEIKIVLGARSAIFAPVANLGLIIVDEEHDASYKQNEESPSYSARSLAIMRGKFANATVVLGSATPSLESFWNASSGKYILSTLSQRANNASLPRVSIVDMKQEKAKAQGFTHFSEALLNGIEKRAANGEQTLLFLNRRGFNTQAFCPICSASIKCLHCSLSLTYHKGENTLACHLCGYNIPPPKVCPTCKEGPLNYKGFGTEHVEKSLKAIFPKIRTLRIDRDTTRQKLSHSLFFKEFRAGKADVLIGTQMIAKGLHFPAVTLVGVLNPDITLNIPDFRASEMVFQLLTQVAGRSGRSEIPGEVIIQTSLPENPIIALAAKQDYLSFYKSEIESRQNFSFPPFSQLTKIVFSGEAEQTVKECGDKFRLKIIEKLPASYTIFPLVTAGRAKVKNKYYFQFLIRGKIWPFTELLANLATFVPKEVHLFVDVDPISTL